MAVKRTKDVNFIGSYNAKTIQSNVVVSDASWKWYFLGNRLLVSDGHPMHLIGTGADVGGPYGSQSCKWVCNPATVSLSTADSPGDPAYRTFSGPIHAWYNEQDGSPLYFPIPASLGENQMAAWGTKGINRTIPTNPHAGLSVFLGELRQLPKRFDPGKWKEALKDLRKLPKRTADEYLNFMFGYVPLVNDMKDFYQVTKEYDRKAQKLMDESGKNLHRKVTLSSNTETGHALWATNYPGAPVLHPDFYVKWGNVDIDVSVTEKVWFEGAYTYYLPGLPGYKEKADKLASRSKRIRQILYGSKPDVETLYNLAPWTWAYDWMFNSGEILHNWNSFTQDQLVLRYGYVMRHAMTKVTYTMTGTELIGIGPISASQTCYLESKQRSKATPYGFGANPDTFSARQWATIAALGISRAPRSLNF